MKFASFLLAFLLWTNAQAATTTAEKVLDVACRVLHAQAHLAKEREGTLQNKKIYENELSSAHTEWRSLWVNASTAEKKRYMNLLQSLHEAQKIAFLFENKETVQPSQNMQQADRFLDAWKEDAAHPTPHGPAQRILDSTLFVRKKDLTSQTPLTLERTNTTEINRNALIQNPLTIEFLTGQKARYTQNTPTNSTVWGSELFKIKSENKVVGYVGLSDNTVMPIYIFPQYQGKGYGYFALQTLIKELRRRHVTQVCGIIDILNLSSILLFESLGFNVYMDDSHYGLEDYPHLYPGFRYTLSI